MPKRRFLTKSNGETDTLVGWSTRTGISQTTISARLARGMTVDEALNPDAHRTTRARPLTVDGERLSIGEWSRRTGLPADMILKRLELGWTESQAVGLSPAPGMIEFRGEFLSKSEIARRLGISAEALRQRLLNGWSLHDALALGNVRGIAKRPGARKRGPRPRA